MKLKYLLLSAVTAFLLPITAHAEFKPAEETLEHPFLLVYESEYEEMRARADREPWKSMKESALNAAADISSFDPNPEMSLFSERVGKLGSEVSAAALAYILDPGKQGVL